MSRITITDLARITGFSKTTISHVLNETSGARIRPETRELIKVAAREHNYVPNYFARNIIRGRTRCVGFLTHSLAEAGRSGELLGVEETCRSNGYQMLIVTADQQDKAESDLIQGIIERGVEGLYADQLSDPEAALDRLKHFGIHLALGQKPSEGLDADVVYEDAEEGFRKVCRQLQELGHKAAAIVSAECSPMAQRRQVAKKVFAEMNFPHREVLVDSHEALAKLDWLDTSIEAGAKPTAAIALCGTLAVGLLTNLISRDRKVPNDCSLLAAGPSTESFFESPKLSWLVWPTIDRGRTAVSRLIERAEGKAENGLPYLTTGLEPKFLQGETIAQAPAQA